MPIPQQEAKPQDSRQQSHSSRRFWSGAATPSRKILLVGGGFTVLFLLSQWTPFRLHTYWLASVSATVAAYYSYFTGKSSQFPRASKFLLLIYLTSASAGDTILVYSYLAHGKREYPYYPDIFYLSNFVWITLALALIIRQVGLKTRGTVIDSIIFILAAIALGAQNLLLPGLHANIPLLARMVNVGYAVGSILIICTTLLATITESHKHRLMRHLLYAIILSTVTGITFSVLGQLDLYHPGDPIDALWIMVYWASAYILWLGNEHPLPRHCPHAKASPQLHRRRIYALTLAAIAAPAASLLSSGDPIEKLLLNGLSIASIILVGLRLSGLHNRTVQQNAALEYQAAHDDLTGLLNRYEFTKLARESLTTGQPLGLLFLDLDGFKAINDSHGHAAGDAVLKQVAQSIQKCAHSNELVSRFAGDEFVILIPGATQMSVDHAANRFTHIIANNPTVYRQHTLHVKASSGTALITEDRTEAALAAALNEADHHMYTNKIKAVRSTMMDAEYTPAGAARYSTVTDLAKLRG